MPPTFSRPLPLTATSPPRHSPTVPQPSPFHPITPATSHPYPCHASTVSSSRGYKNTERKSHRQPILKEWHPEVLESIRLLATSSDE
eukprot:3972210-Alexandrium_andersonii.AAC.1